MPNHRVCAVCLPGSIANPHITSLASHAQTLLDMPTEVLATICALCDVPTKMVSVGPSVLLCRPVCMRASIERGSDSYPC
jgi:hypothetical protein